MNEQKLIDEIKKLAQQQDIITGFFNGREFVADGGVTYPFDSLILTNSQPGEGFIVKKDDKWLCVVGSATQLVRTQIITDARRRRKEEKDEYLVKSISRRSDKKARIGLFTKEKVIYRNNLGYTYLDAFITNLGKKKYNSTVNVRVTGKNGYVYKSNKREEIQVNELNTPANEAYLGNTLWESISDRTNTRRITFNDGLKHYNDVSYQTTDLTDTFGRRPSRDRVVWYVDTWTLENSQSRFSYIQNLDSRTYFPDPTIDERNPPGVILQETSNTNSVALFNLEIYVMNGETFVQVPVSIPGGSSGATEMVNINGYTQFLSAADRVPKPEGDNSLEMGQTRRFVSYVYFDREEKIASKSNVNGVMTITYNINISNIREVVYQEKVSYITAEDIYTSGVLFDGVYDSTKFTAYSTWTKAVERTFDKEGFIAAYSSTDAEPRHSIDESFLKSYTETVSIQGTSATYMRDGEEVSTLNDVVAYRIRTSDGGERQLVYSDFAPQTLYSGFGDSVEVLAGDVTASITGSRETDDIELLPEKIDHWYKDLTPGTSENEGSPGSGQIENRGTVQREIDLEFYPYEEEPFQTKGTIKDEDYSERYSGKFLIQRNAYGYIYQDVAGVKITSMRRNKVNDEIVYNVSEVFTETRNILTYKFKNKTIALNNDEFLIAHSPTINVQLNENTTFFTLSGTISGNIPNGYSLGIFTGRRCLYNKDNFLIKGIISSVTNSESSFTINISVLSIKAKTKTTFDNIFLLDNGSFYNYFLKNSAGYSLLTKEIMKKSSASKFSVLHNPFVRYFGFTDITPIQIHRTDNIVKNKIFCVIEVVKKTAFIEEWKINDNGTVSFIKVFKTKIIPTETNSDVRARSYHP